jgi:hypothetical protein
MAHDTLFAMMGLSLAGGLGAFLIFNFTPARIFMGDTGSMLIGLVNAILVMHFIRVADAPSALVPVVSAPMIGLSVLMVPLFDTLRVFTVRIVLHRRSPFSPDKSHIHHILLDCGFSHSAVTLTLASYSLLIITASFLLKGEGNHFLLGTLTVASVGFTGLATYFRRLRISLASRREAAVVVTASEDIYLEAPSLISKSGQMAQGGVVVVSGIQPVYSLEEE